MAESPISGPVDPNNLLSRRSPDFRTIYTNNVRFSITPFDFSFILNEITENERGEIYSDQKARITMTPLQAKIFAFVLTQNVKNFEKQFGDIHVPENLFKLVEIPTVAEQTTAEESSKPE
jgi:hypothetical protein